MAKSAVRNGASRLDFIRRAYWLDNSLGKGRWGDAVCLVKPARQDTKRRKKRREYRQR